MYRTVVIDEQETSRLQNLFDYIFLDLVNQRLERFLCFVIAVNGRHEVWVNSDVRKILMSEKHWQCFRSLDHLNQLCIRGVEQVV